MTRKRADVSRAIAWWHGEPGTISTYRVGLTGDLAARYVATGRVRLTENPTTVTVLSLTVKDRETGAAVRRRGTRTIVHLADDAADDYVVRLLDDARTILATARRGRRRGTYVDDESIRTVVRMLKRDQAKVGLKAIAARSGTFTHSQLRYWLRANGRHLADYL